VENFAASAKNLEEERNRLIQQVSDFESRAEDATVVEDLKKKLDDLESANRHLRQQLEELKLSVSDRTQVSTCNRASSVKSLQKPKPVGCLPLFFSRWPASIIKALIAF
jgi:regulator of replication initiation timing